MAGRCSLGVLSADAASCRSTPQGAAAEGWNVVRQAAAAAGKGTPPVSVSLLCSLVSVCKLPDYRCADRVSLAERRLPSRQRVERVHGSKLARQKATVAGTWRVFEADFFDNADCQGGRERTSVTAESQRLLFSLACH